jgi:hypothetical protein
LKAETWVENVRHDSELEGKGGRKEDKSENHGRRRGADRNEVVRTKVRDAVYLLKACLLKADCAGLLERT